MSIDVGAVFQQGYIVANLEEAAQEWIERVGAGPFYVMDHLAMENYYYRGKHTPIEMRMAFGYWGPMQIELIQPLGSATSLYSDALKTGADKLNHCATFINGSLDELLDTHDLRKCIIHEGHMPTGLKFAYLDSYLPDGSHLELIQATEEARMGFQGMQAIHAQWDKQTRPIRPIADLGKDLGSR